MKQSAAQFNFECDRDGVGVAQDIDEALRRSAALALLVPVAFTALPWQRQCHATARQRQHRDGGGTAYLMVHYFPYGLNIF
jgi:hypothetical protein